MGSRPAETGLSDLGCVYTWGGRQSLLIDHNLCWNVSAYSYGGNGFYDDQTSVGVTWTNNVVHTTRGPAFFNHEGINITVENNVFVGDAPDPAEGTLGSADPQPSKGWKSSASMNRNILFGRSGVLFKHPISDAQPWSGSSFSENVYYRENGTIPKFPGNISFADWQKAGRDIGSKVADPLFIDSAANDFGLRPGSPATALGFVSIDLASVGPRPPPLALIF